MERSLNTSLAKITGGAVLALVGISVGTFLSFMGKLVVARYGNETEYGIFSLALAVLNACAVIATLGLQQGLTRSIAYTRGRQETEKVQLFISASLWFGSVASMAMCFILLFTSQIMANTIFHEAGLVFPLRIFAAVLPFFVLMNITVSLFRGLDEIKPQVYFQNIGVNALFLLFLLVVHFLNVSFHGVFYAYMCSFIISFIALALYTIRRLPSPLKFTIGLSLGPAARGLLFFSLPLLGMAAMYMVIAWTDTFMLGYFKSSAVVGLYNAALPLAQFISMPLGALLIAYTPVTSGLYGQGLLLEIKRNYRVVTKWVCSATLPLFLIMFLFPETFIHFIFGADYIPAAGALRILSLGFIINNFLGPGGATLVAMGRPQFMMWSALATALLNIVLNMILIPPLGIAGAAIASVSAMTTVNLLLIWRLFSISRVQPFSKNLMKPSVASIGLIVIIYLVSINFIDITFWILPVLFVLYYVIYCLTMLVTRSFDNEDIALLLNIEKKLGVNAALVKRIMRRFL